MKLEASISGEHFDHKVAAIFQDEFSAKRAVDILRRKTSLNDRQIFIVGPNDRHPGWELEPEDSGMWRTMLQAHVWLGLAGAAVGLVLFFILFAVGIPFVVANAIPAAILAVVFCGVFGLMFGGLVTLRPDHMPYISVSQSALRKGKYIVAVHAANTHQLDEASQEFKALNVKTVSSL